MLSQFDNRISYGRAVASKEKEGLGRPALTVAVSCFSALLSAAAAPAPSLSDSSACRHTWKETGDWNFIFALERVASFTLHLFPCPTQHRLAWSAYLAPVPAGLIQDFGVKIALGRPFLPVGFAIGLETSHEGEKVRRASIQLKECGPFLTQLCLLSPSIHSSAQQKAQESCFNHSMQKSRDGETERPWYSQLATRQSQSCRFCSADRRQTSSALPNHFQKCIRTKNLSLRLTSWSASPRYLAVQRIQKAAA
jgi:hypothetical protein